MPAATVTIRELKNKDTGIDLSVPTYKEIKGLLGSSYEYHVMVVSNLSYFKTAKHKESDNVQFMIPKKFPDFEELYTKMNAKYCGTAFPPLPKKVLLMNDTVAKERRSGLEYIMKFLAMTPKLCTCPLLLQFLGVSPMKAGRMKNMEVADKIVAEQDKPHVTEEQDKLGTEKEEPELTENLFDEDDDQDDDDSDMFSGVPSSREEDNEVDTKIFEDQELGGGINDGEGDDLFLTDAKLENTQATDRLETGEDNSDLFQIDDDLERIMTLDLKPKHNVDIVDDDPSQTSDKYSATTESTQPKLPERPEIKSKPNITKKPVESEAKTDIDFDEIVAKSEKVENVSQRPTPAPRKKPVNRDRPNVPKRPEISKDKPNVPKRPEIAAKPKIADKPKVIIESQSDKTEVVENINEDNILKYIQENTASEDDIDLFS